MLDVINNFLESYSSLITFLGLMFTIAAIYFSFRSKYDGQIIFLVEQAIDLFNSIGDSIDDLSVSYKGRPVSEDLVLLNGVLVNSGRRDISPDMVEKPISILLPKSCQWLDGKVTDASCTATVSVVNDYSLKVSTGLFRRGEYIKFHALAKVFKGEGSPSASYVLRNKMGFSHRISDTGKVEYISSSLLNRSWSDVLGEVFFLAILSIMSFIFISLAFSGDKAWWVLILAGLFACFFLFLAFAVLFEIYGNWVKRRILKHVPA